MPHEGAGAFKVRIQNDGPRVVSTDYWQTEHAARGLVYVSGNAGVWRLLLPRAAHGCLPGIRTGKSVSIEPSLQEPARCWDVVFEDGSDSPFFIAVDSRQFDRAVEPGRNVRLTIYPEGLDPIEFGA